MFERFRIFSLQTKTPQAAPPSDGGVFMALCLVMFPAGGTRKVEFQLARQGLKPNCK